MFKMINQKPAASYWLVSFNLLGILDSISSTIAHI